jgi:hypothetical protein
MEASDNLSGPAALCDSASAEVSRIVHGSAEKRSAGSEESRLLDPGSVDRTGSRPSRITARSARAHRRRADAAAAAGVGGKHGEAPLQLFAVARRALRCVASAHERFEFVVAFLTGVFEQRHVSIIARDDNRHPFGACRYALRPPVAHHRIRLTEQGQVLLDLRHRWADGTSHLLFDPVERLERLAVLTPRPRINLVLYYGVLGARSAWRSRLGDRDASPPAQASVESEARPEPAVSAQPSRREPSNLLWAELMQRSFGFDVLACPQCGGRLRLIAVIDEARVIRRILGHLGLPTEVPAARPSRAPPMPFDGEAGRAAAGAIPVP